MNAERLDLARGCLLGLAVGDAIGTTVEFKPRGSFTPMTDMVGGGPFGLKAGEWTDDTSMALCLGASLLDHGFDLHDQISRYVRWQREGYMSSNGRCFDIGIATSQALSRFKANNEPRAGSTDPYSAGNGCLMRLAPVPIRYANHLELAVKWSGEQATSTHGAVECVEASRLLGEILTMALRGEHDKLQLLKPQWPRLSVCTSARLQAIAEGAYFETARTNIKGSGYVVDSLEAALWCFYTTDNFQDAVLAAANLGDDADTTAAITGQIAGAFYGEAGIPAAWLAKVVMAQEIGSMAEQLSTAGEL
jgi:ADP-ribosyl-[dinitrogen reductase] hydrolase